MLSFTNIMTTLTAIVAATYGFMTDVLHCTGELSNATCAAPWVPTQVLGYLTLGFGVVAFVSKLLRPGGTGASLWGPTAVVVSADSPHSVAGTATPEHVAQP